jgi:hypothetical protein
MPGLGGSYGAREIEIIFFYKQGAPSEQGEVHPDIA